MTPRISPFCNEKLRLSTAASPPKRLVSCATCRSGWPCRLVVPPRALDAVGCDKASDTSHPLSKTIGAEIALCWWEKNFLDQTQNTLRKEERDQDDRETEQRIMQTQPARLELERGPFKSNRAEQWSKNGACPTKEG